MFDYTGIFESHITVSHNTPEFREIAKSNGWKTVLIELPYGEHPSQPMVNLFHKGVAGDAISKTIEIAKKFNDVQRIKVEAYTKNEQIPQYDIDTILHPGTNYFEYHWKLNLPLGADLDLLQSICKKYDVHLSKNAFKHYSDHSERFVTMRKYKTGRISAEQFGESVVKALTLNGFCIVSFLKEYTIFDTKAELDQGWMCGDCKECPFLDK